MDNVRLSWLLSKESGYKTEKYKNLAEVVLYLVHKYGTTTERDVQLADRILCYDEQIYKFNVFVPTDLVYEVLCNNENITEEQKHNRLAIKGELV